MTQTSLYAFNIQGYELKSTVVSFTLTQEIYRPATVSAKFFKTRFDAIYSTCDVGDTIHIRLSDDIGNYYVFYGDVKKLIPDGIYYRLTASGPLGRMYDYIHTEQWASTAHSTIMTDIIESCPYDAGTPSYLTATGTPTYTTTLTDYNVIKGRGIDQLNKLVWYSANAASETLTVFRENPASRIDIAIEDWGETVPSVDIVLSHDNGAIRGRVPYSNILDNIINIVHTSYKTGYHTSGDSDTGGCNTSSSRTTHGNRVFNVYTPEVTDIDDVIAMQATLLRQFQWSYDVIGPVDVYERALHGNSLHYPVLNTLYTITDNLSTTYADWCCTKRVLTYPSFRNQLWFAPRPHPTLSGYVGEAENKSIAMAQESGGWGCAFRAYVYTGSTAMTTTPVTVDYDHEIFDYGSNFDTTNCRFVAPVSGIYYFYAQAIGSGMDVGSHYYLNMIKNSSTQASEDYYCGSDAERMFRLNSLVQLDATDYVYCTFSTSDASPDWTMVGDASGIYSFFLGFLVTQL